MQPPNLSDSLDLVQMTPLISTVWIVIQAARITALFLAEVSKISLMARNRLVFLAEVRDICYICMI